MSNIEKVKEERKYQFPANRNQFLQQFSPGKCMRVFNKANTPALAMKSEAPTLASIRKNYSEDFMIAYIAVWIVNLNDFVNASRKMGPEQIEETAFMIYQEYYYLNLADINLVFRKIKKGEFGQLFAELDGVKILGWFDKYSKERMNEAVEDEISGAAAFADEFERTSDKEKTKNQQSIGLFIQEHYGKKA